MSTSILVEYKALSSYFELSKAIEVSYCRFEAKNKYCRMSLEIKVWRVVNTHMSSGSIVTEIKNIDEWE